MILSVGIPNSDIWFDQSKAAKQLSTKDEITKDELLMIPQMLENPIAIAESYDNTVIVFGELKDEHGNPIVIAVRINSVNRRNNVTIVNKIRSIGARNKNKLNGLLADGKILYLNPNKKETNKWFNALGRSTPFGGTKFGLIRSVSFQIPEVKTKMSTRDNEGNTLSEGQQRYFADSKVRDENGNLMVVYHGTDADFTVFDRTRGRLNADINGLFFSPYKQEAQDYGQKVKPYYLNITNTSVL